MKIRNGFVSNSSSSAFVCPVCQETGDGEYTDTVWCDVCNNEFCEDCASANQIKKTGKNCPTCSLSIINDEDFVAYLLKSRSLDKQLIETEIRAHGTLKNLKQWLRSK
jgi:hypothetical protein